MTSDPEDELREHFEPARRAELPPDSFDRLVERLDAPLAPLHPRRIPKLVAVAAVLVLLAGVAAVVAAAQDGDDGQDVHTLDRTTSTSEPVETSSTTEPEPTSTTEATTTTASTTTTPTSTTSTVPGRDGRPDTIAAVVDPDGDGDGALVVLDAYTGRVLRTLLPGGAADVDVAPDGTIYVQSSPPPGADYDTSITAIDPVTGAHGSSYGSSQRPSISPDGHRLARGEPGTVVSGPLPSGPAEIVAGIEVGPDRGGNNHYLGDLAWSRDGRFLALGQIDQQVYGVRQPPVPRVFVVDLDASPDDSARYLAVDVAGAASPVFPADGSLLVVGGATGPASGSAVTGDRIVAWDLGAGRVTGEVPVPHVSRLDASADGRWVIATRAGRTPHLVMRPGAVGDLGPLPQAPEGIVAAAW